MIYNEIDREVGLNDFSDSAKTYYQDLKRHKPLPRDVERELIVKAKAGDIEARNKILTANLRFVFNIAKKYRGHGVDLSDLISEGNDGMIKAIEKFDITQNVKFFSYAVWWIRQRMTMAISKHQEKEMIETDFEGAFSDDNGHIDNIYVNDDDDINDSGFDIMGENCDELELNEEAQQKHFIVEKVLAKLDDRERLIIEKYFGIENDDDGQNLEEISKDLHITTERVRQLKVKAINEMRAEVFNLKEAEFLF